VITRTDNIVIPRRLSHEDLSSRFQSQKLGLARNQDLSLIRTQSRKRGLQIPLTWLIKSSVEVRGACQSVILKNLITKAMFESPVTKTRALRPQFHVLSFSSPRSQRFSLDQFAAHG